jgi:hypothetical protein
MTTGATGQLGLALPVQGELSGTWGDTVNNGITQYTNIAIAGTLTLTGDGAVTLANTTGDASASNITSTLTGAGTVTAQFAIVKVTGTLTVAKVVTGPSYSKTYTVVNSATGGIVTFKASGQTGVSVAVGETAFVYFNGTDYVKIVGTATAGAAGGSNTQIQYNSSGILAGSANMTFNGTTLTVNDLTDSSLTATRIVFAGTAGNLNDSASLTWNGTTLSSTQVNITGQGTLRLEDTTGGEYVGLRSPGTLGASYTLTFPADDGTSGQALITDGSGVLSWSTAASGDVYGPASSTDNAVARFDSTTGKLLQNSVVIVGDTGDVTGVGTLSAATLTLTNALGTAYGGTGLTSFTSGGVVYASSTSALATGSALYFDSTNTRLGIGTASPAVSGIEISKATGTATPTPSELRLSTTSTGSDWSTTDPWGRISFYSADTSSGGAKVHASIQTVANGPTGGVSNFEFFVSDSTNATLFKTISFQPAGANLTQTIFYSGGGTERMRLDTSGSLLLATTLQNGTKLNVMGGDIVPATSGTTQTGGLRVSSLATGNGGIVLDMGASNTSSYAWMQVSNSGNLSSGFAKPLVIQPVGGVMGLGVVPTDWSSSYKALQINTTSNISATSNTLRVGNNEYVNTSSIGTYLTTGFATTYYQNSSGQHVWYNAPSGTAGNAITFTQAMTLDASGNLGVGTTSPATYGKFVVQSSGNAIIARSGNTSFCELNVQSGTSDEIKGQFQAILGSSNKVIIGSRTNHPLAFNIFDTEKMRLDTSGNLGLGVTPSAWVSTYKAFELFSSGCGVSSDAATKIQLAANFYRVSGADKYGTTGEATLYSQASGVHKWFNAPSGTAGTNISFSQAMTLSAAGGLSVGLTTDPGAGAISARSVSNPHVFDSTSGTEVIGISKANGNKAYLGTVSSSDSGLQVKDSAGALTLTVGSSGKTLTLQGGTVATGTGITFPATQSASSDANTLDDYEEGTWTPTLTFDTAGDLSVVYSVRAGIYTKIGRQVFCQLWVVATTFTYTTASGNLNLTGLPFTVLSTTANTNGTVGSYRGLALKASYATISSEAQIGTSTCLFLQTAYGTSALAYTNTAEVSSGNQKEIRMQFSYVA